MHWVLLKLALGSLLHVSLSLMNRLNKTEPAMRYIYFGVSIYISLYFYRITLVIISTKTCWSYSNCNTNILFNTLQMSLVWKRPIPTNMFWQKDNGHACVISTKVIFCVSLALRVLFSNIIIYIWLNHTHNYIDFTPDVRSLVGLSHL